MLWNQFRRLLLGTVMEVLLEEKVELDFRSIQISFDGDSAFKVPRLDNYMRFKGALTADLVGGMDANRIAKLEARMKLAWPELLAVLDLPIGDRLTTERNELRVTVEGRKLRVDFDLAAD